MLLGHRQPPPACAVRGWGSSGLRACCLRGPVYISCPSNTNGIYASYGPFYLKYFLLADFTLIMKQKLPSVYVLPSYQSALLRFGVMFNPSVHAEAREKMMTQTKPEEQHNKSVHFLGLLLTVILISGIGIHQTQVRRRQLHLGQDAR
ncbi:hypothetical protein Celaphus_00015266 [Cervus elaphus hippelaphus]|uniref:Uncharacterized protein n=1 Tax=Cervus elaphus hippelaphus TaxID=46360 RepID=A0A212CSG6_CEREH|nr:hypothetical protein Celaphus_00015266 [Cervus elaphus hippelaphus]